MFEAWTRIQQILKLPSRASGDRTPTQYIISVFWCETPQTDTSLNWPSFSTRVLDRAALKIYMAKFWYISFATVHKISGRDKVEIRVSWISGRPVIFWRIGQSPR